MNKKYRVNYQSQDWSKNFIQELPTREEGDELAQELQESGYENIIIEEIKI